MRNPYLKRPGTAGATSISSRSSTNSERQANCNPATHSAGGEEQSSDVPSSPDTMKESARVSTSTNSGYKTGKATYDAFSKKEGTTAYEDLRHDDPELRSIVSSFADYCIKDLRQKNGKHYKGDTPKQFFSNFWNGLTKQDTFANGNAETPYWYGCLYKEVATRTSNTAKEVLGETDLRNVKAITRSTHIALVLETLANCQPGENNKAWTTAYVWFIHFCRGFELMNSGCLLTMFIIQFCMLLWLIQSYDELQSFKCW